MPPKDKRTLDFSHKISRKLSEHRSDEQLRGEFLAIHSQMLGHILPIPGTLTQLLETGQKRSSSPQNLFRNKCKDSPWERRGVWTSVHLDLSLIL